MRSLDSLKARLRHLSAQWTDVDNYIADLCDQHADALDDVAEAIQESTLTKRRKKEA